MKITVTLPEGKKRTASLPYEGSPSVEIAEPCTCGSKAVRGTGKNREATQWDEIEDAVCANCGVGRGRIHVKLETLFGRDEDARILNGRWRVY